MVLYSDDSLSHGEKPATGWEYTLVFLAPSAEDFSNEVDKNTSYFWTGEKSRKEAANQAGHARAAILDVLRKKGFSYSQLWVPDGSFILVRVALPEEKLHELAEKQMFELKLRARYGGGYLAYTRRRRQYYVNDKLDHFFTPSQRLRINLDCLGSTEEWGAGIDVETLKVDGVLVDSYPLHDKVVRNELLNEVVKNRWWDPLFRPSFGRLKDYHGARVTLYFAYLNFFARMLVGVSLISIPIYLLLNIDFPHPWVTRLRFVYACILVFWGAYFVKNWIRRNHILNVKWGNFDYFEDTFYEVRPQFIGNPRRGFYSRGGFVDLADLDPNSSGATLSSEGLEVTDENDENDPDADTKSFTASALTHSLVQRFGSEDPDFELAEESAGFKLRNRDLPAFPYADPIKERNVKIKTWLITVLFISIMALLTFLLLFFKETLLEVFADYSWGNQVPGVLLGVLIFCGENGWKAVYPILAKWENHRTRQTYMDSLIIKRFSFEFVANYLSLFYIAFFKNYTPLDPCEISPFDGKPDCMFELHNMVASLVITKATIQQLMELGIPTLIIIMNRLQLWYAWYSSGEDGNSELRRGLLDADDETTEEDSDEAAIKESKLNTFDNTVEDYGELIIQFGYVALFGLAYPLAAFVFFINNVIEMRSDSFKYLFIRNRAPADVAAHIGRWLDILKFLVRMSVWTNAGILIFTSDEISETIADVSASDLAKFFILKQLFQWITTFVKKFWSDIPNQSYRRKARQDFLIAKWFHVNDKPYYRRTLVQNKDFYQEVEEDTNQDLLSVLEQHSNEN